MVLDCGRKTRRPGGNPCRHRVRENIQTLQRKDLDPLGSVASVRMFSFNTNTVSSDVPARTEKVVSEFNDSFIMYVSRCSCFYAVVT